MNFTANPSLATGLADTTATLSDLGISFGSSGMAVIPPIDANLQLAT